MAQQRFAPAARITDRPLVVIGNTSRPLEHGRSTSRGLKRPRSPVNKAIKRSSRYYLKKS